MTHLLPEGGSISVQGEIVGVNRMNDMFEEERIANPGLRKVIVD